MEVVLGKGVRLEATSVFLVFPVLEYVFTQPTILRGCESAFLVLDYCWPLSEDGDEVDSRQLSALRPLLKGFIIVCLRVLTKFRVEPPPEHVLSRIVSSVILEKDEWEVIISEYGILSRPRNVRFCCLKIVSDAKKDGRLHGHYDAL